MRVVHAGRTPERKPLKRKAPPTLRRSLENDLGAGNRSRTCDLRITNAPLYQLSYSGGEGEF